MDSKKLLEMVKSKHKAMARRERTVKCNPGKNRVRILPGWRAEQQEVFWHDFGQHYIKGDDGEVKAVYVCAEKTFGKPCTVCSSLAKAIKSSRDDTVVALLGDAKASERILVNALMLDGDDPATPVILELPPTVFKGVLALFEEWGNVIDSAEGRDLIITREGKGIGTKYTVSPAAKQSSLPTGVMGKLHNLDEYVAQENAEQQGRAIAAISSIAGVLVAPSAPALASPDKPASAAKSESLASTTRANPPIEAESEVLLDEELDALLETGA